MAIMASFRLDKFLAQMGCGARSEVKKYIKSGRVKVNNETVKVSELKIDTDKDIVLFDDIPLAYTEFEYYMLNKPQGVVSATEDRYDKTVIDLIETKIRKDLFPVGRLDKDTEGLLLITNDGRLSHNLLSPKKHVDKLYYAVIDSFVPDELVNSFKEGITLSDGTVCMPADLRILKQGETSEIELIIHEGKFHQVKRMFEAFYMSVTYLKRLRMGSLILDESLAPGEYRSLTGEEVCALKGEKF